MASGAIILAMPSKILLSVDGAGKADADWPDGKACLMVKFLLEKYQDSSVLANVNARRCQICQDRMTSKRVSIMLRQ